MHTIEKNGNVQVAIEIKGSLYTLEAMRIQVQVMNALIIDWEAVSGMLKEKIRKVETGQIDIQSALMNMRLYLPLFYSLKI